MVSKIIFGSPSMSVAAARQRFQRILIPMLERAYGEYNENAPKEVDIDQDNNLLINGIPVGDWRLISSFKTAGQGLSFKYGADATRMVMFGPYPLDVSTCHKVDVVAEFKLWSTAEPKMIYNHDQAPANAPSGDLKSAPKSGAQPDAQRGSSQQRHTVVVNLVGGPGAGKTTCAWEIAAELKKVGLVVEYVPEVAKEYVWEERTDLLDGTLEHQRELYEKQNHRVQRLIGKVDVVVTDSPIILNLIYLKEKNQDFENEVIAQFKAQTNFTLLVRRGTKFEKEGRIHTQEQSAHLDKDILNLLDKNGIYYGIYGHSQMRQCVQNIQTTLKKQLNKNQIPPAPPRGAHL